MYRYLLGNLDKWHKSQNRKPLILQGSRQVGKTHLLKTWGDATFAKVHIVNFERTPSAARVFERDFDPKRILSELVFLLGEMIDPTTDLVIFDEIQACPKALTSLKYFCEDMPELVLVSAGSLLGVALTPESFPVGKIEFMQLYPMSFPEFLKAVDTKNTLDILPTPSVQATISEVVHEHLWRLLCLYYVTGGMPEAVLPLANERDLNSPKVHNILKDVRKIQRAIIASYDHDFAKHAGKLNSIHIQALYRNIPSQLAAVHDESIKRFQFGDVLANKKGFAMWERPLHWLKNAGLVYQIKIANKSAHPLEHYTKPNLFKLIPNDVGLLGCMQDLEPAVLLDQSFGIAKGYFAEVYVAQALMNQSRQDQSQQLYSWHEGESEIEFFYTQGKKIVPIEVKAGSRTKSRSLAQYLSKYAPELAIRLSTRSMSYDSDRKLLNLPLPLAHWIEWL